MKMNNVKDSLIMKPKVIISIKLNMITILCQWLRHFHLSRA